MNITMSGVDVVVCVMIVNLTIYYAWSRWLDYRSRK